MPTISALTTCGSASTTSHRHGLLSGIFSFAGHVVARTKRLRIGTAVVVLPFHNPIVVAEEAAMLDVLSGGRLDLGIGSGYQRMEFDGLGVDVEESRARFREAIDVMIKAWTEEKLTFSRPVHQRRRLDDYSQTSAKATSPTLHSG